MLLASPDHASILITVLPLRTTHRSLSVLPQNPGFRLYALFVHVQNATPWREPVVYRDEPLGVARFSCNIVTAVKQEGDTGMTRDPCTVSVCDCRIRH